MINICFYTAENFITLKSGFEASGTDIHVSAILQPCKTSRLIDYNSNQLNITLGNGELKLFPNPAHDNVSIEFFTSSESNYKITLFDIIGRNVMSLNGYSSDRQNEIKLNISDLLTGVYFVEFTNDEFRKVTENY